MRSRGIGRVQNVFVYSVLPANAQHQHVDDVGMGARIKGAAKIGMLYDNGMV